MMLVTAWLVGHSLVSTTNTQNRRVLIANLFKLTGMLIFFFSALAVSTLFSYDTFYKSIVGFASNTPVISTAADTQNVLAKKITDEQARGNRSLYMDGLARIHVRQIVSDNLAQMRNNTETSRQWYFKALTIKEEDLKIDDPSIVEINKFLAQNSTLAASRKSWTDYLNNMQKVIDFGRSSVNNIRDINKKLTEVQLQKDLDRAKKIGKHRQDFALEDQKSKEAIVEQKQLRNTIQELTKNITELKALIKTKEEEKIKAANRMECELKGRQCIGAPPTNPGIGPKYRKAEAEHKDAELQLKQLQTQLNTKEQNKKKAQAKLNAAIEIHSEAKKQIDISKKEILALGGVIDGKSGTNKGDVIRLSSTTELEKKINSMAKIINGLETPDAFGLPDKIPEDIQKFIAQNENENIGTSQLQQLQEKCQSLINELSRKDYGKVADDAKQFQCSQKGISVAVERLKDLNMGLIAFDSRGCRFLGIKFLNENTTRMIERGQECLQTTRLDGKPAQEHWATLSKLKQEHDGTVHRFVQSLNGLLAYHDWLAFLSLGIALIVDLMILATGVVGAYFNQLHTDRIGEELSGKAILDYLTTEMEEAELFDAHVQVDPQTATKSGMAYTGYISEYNPDTGRKIDITVLSKLIFLLGKKKNGISLVIKDPPNSEDVKNSTSVFIGDYNEDDSVRYYILGEVLTDLKKKIKSWKKIYGSSTNEKQDRITPNRSKINKTSYEPAPQKKNSVTLVFPDNGNEKEKHHDPYNKEAPAQQKAKKKANSIDRHDNELDKPDSGIRHERNDPTK